jgi:hypothetical protein
MRASRTTGSAAAASKDGDGEPGVQQTTRVHHQQGGVADAERVGAEEGEPVAGAESRRLDGGVGQALGGVDEVVPAPYPALAEQRQRHVGEVGEISGAQRPQLTGERCQPGVERAHQRVQQLAGDARPAGPDLVGARRHRGADDGHGEDEAGPAGMAAQQVEAVGLALLIGHPVGPQRPDARGDAVKVVAAGQQRGDGCSRPVVARPRLGGQDRRRAVARDGRDPPRGQARTVEDDRRALAVREGRCRHRAAL